MIKDSKYRPLILKGKIGEGKYSLLSVCRDSECIDGMDKVKIVLENDEFTKGYEAYIFEGEKIAAETINYLVSKDIPYICGLEEIATLVDKDVVEINPLTLTVRVLYRANSTDNFLMLTNKCNNNCIMCPDSLKTRTENRKIPVDIIKRQIDLIDKKTPFLCITGGEPTLLKEEFIEIISYCKEKLPETEYILLSNGRMFYYKKFAEDFSKSRPKNLIIAMPIHGHSPELHDSIAGIKDSFIQTFYGIKNLYNMGEKIELRIVVNRLNYKVLSNISAMISKYFPKVLRVNFMAMEMLGNAVTNKEKVWIDFQSVQPELKKAILILLKSGITVKVYNFPLCCLDKSLWNLNVRSISDYKIRYKDKCQSCSAIKTCGGFFNSTINMKDIVVSPIEARS
ncbi:His-Xaa-Ser system radical SAM maturase HxsC [Clostridiaceae bacterium UIB06]|nr:His-Xaa-Ser system radical SAM maturase HxsC [Clostridiaceae bacterium UIB06]